MSDNETETLDEIHCTTAVIVDYGKLLPGNQQKDVEGPMNGECGGPVNVIVRHKRSPAKGCWMLTIQDTVAMCSAIQLAPHLNGLVENLSTPFSATISKTVVVRGTNEKTLLVNEMHLNAVPVEDVRKAIAYYGEVAGIKPKPEEAPEIRQVLIIELEPAVRNAVIEVLIPNIKGANAFTRDDGKGGIISGEWLGFDCEDSSGNLRGVMFANMLKEYRELVTENAKVKIINPMVQAKKGFPGSEKYSAVVEIQIQSYTVIERSVKRMKSIHV